MCEFSLEDNSGPHGGGSASWPVYKYGGSLTSGTSGVLTEVPGMCDMYYILVGCVQYMKGVLTEVPDPISVRSWFWLDPLQG